MPDFLMQTEYQLASFYNAVSSIQKPREDNREIAYRQNRLCGPMEAVAGAALSRAPCPGPAGPLCPAARPVAASCSRRYAGEFSGKDRTGYTTYGRRQPVHAVQCSGSSNSAGELPVCASGRTGAGPGPGQRPYLCPAALVLRSVQPAAAKQPTR